MTVIQVEKKSGSTAFGNKDNETLSTIFLKHVWKTNDANESNILL